MYRFSFWTVVKLSCFDLRSVDISWVPNKWMGGEGGGLRKLLLNNHSIMWSVTQDSWFLAWEGALVLLNPQLLERAHLNTFKKEKGDMGQKYMYVHAYPQSFLLTIKYCTHYDYVLTLVFTDDDGNYQPFSICGTFNRPSRTPNNFICV